MRLLYMLLALACAYPCSDVLELSKDEATTRVRENPPELSQACITLLISKGYWEPALLVASKAVEAEIPLSEDLRASVFKAHDEVSKLLHTFTSRPQLPVYFPASLTPALYWAQSRTHVYIDIRFSHVAADPEPCLKLEDLKVEYDSERLKLSGVCGHRGHRFKYLLNMPLLGEVNPRDSSHQVFTGHAEVTLAKSAPALWNDLSDKKPPVLEKWWRKQRLVDTLSEL